MTPDREREWAERIANAEGHGRVLVENVRLLLAAFAKEVREEERAQGSYVDTVLACIEADAQRILDGGNVRQEARAVVGHASSLRRELSAIRAREKGGEG